MKEYLIKEIKELENKVNFFKKLVDKKNNKHYEINFNSYVKYTGQLEISKKYLQYIENNNK